MLEKKFVFALLVLVLCLAPLLACSSGAGGTEDAVSSENEGEETGGTASGDEGTFDWRNYEGEQLNLLLVQHPFAEAIQPLFKDFEEQTGITLNVQMLAETEYWNKLTIDLSSGGSSYDVFMNGPSLAWQHIMAGWLEPLDAYMDDAAKTNPDYDVDDFYKAFLDANRWNGTPGEEIGEGGLYTIPVMAETTILSYRKDLFEKYDVDVPTTFAEWQTAAEKLTVNDDGEQIYGVIQRGAKDISSINAGFHSGYYTYGAQDFDDDFNSVINSEKAVEFTDLWIDTIKKYGPSDWTNVAWFDLMERFAAGNYAMSLNTDFMAATFEDESKSSVAGKVGYTVIPAGPDGNRSSNIWTWGLSMNSNSNNKDAAWLFMQWATGKDVLLASAQAGNLDPVRRSVWESDEVIAMTSVWDDGNWRKAVEQNLEEYAVWQPTPHTELGATWDRWILALHQIWSGEGATQDILDQANQDIDDILSNAGIK